MQARSTFALVTALVLSLPAIGCSGMCPVPAAAPAQAAPQAAARPPEARHVYRFDFLLSSGGAYSLTLEEGHSGDLRVGTNVPLSGGAGPSPRQDVGLNLHASFAMAGDDDVLLHTNLDMSSIEEPGGAGAAAVHKLSTASDVLLAPGKQVIVSSVEETVGHRRHDLKVMATKVR